MEKFLGFITELIFVKYVRLGLNLEFMYVYEYIVVWND